MNIGGLAQMDIIIKMFDILKYIIRSSFLKIRLGIFNALST